MSESVFSQIRKAWTLPVIVAALGYLVDIFDLVLFSMLRVQSLQDLGLHGDEILSAGENILTVQMFGFLLGGILWGVLGDKIGRKTILFGSIALYSVANIANAFVHDVTTYAVIRFFAGLGLAGELGAAVTLVSEILPTQLRGYGTMLVATVGLLGAVLAGVLAHTFPWRIMYIIGGVLGMALLVTRARLLEPGIFTRIKSQAVRRGDFLSLFTSRDRFSRYVKGILIGVPIWYAVGILIVFAPEMARHLGVRGEVSAIDAVMWCYLGVAFGDMVSGTLSQVIGSRRKAVMIFLSMLAAMVVIYFLLRGIPAWLFYVESFILGFATGYWAVFITIAAEQFGTNLRATVATTTPNFVRGSVALITPAFKVLRQHLSIEAAALVIGAVVIALAWWSIATIAETHDRDLDFIEPI